MKRLLVVFAMLCCVAGCDGWFAGTASDPPADTVKTDSVFYVGDLAPGDSVTVDIPLAVATESADVYVDDTSSFDDDFVSGSWCLHDGKHKYACGNCGYSKTVDQWEQNNLTGMGNWGQSYQGRELHCIKCFDAGKGTIKMAYLGRVYVCTKPDCPFDDVPDDKEEK